MDDRAFHDLFFDALSADRGDFISDWALSSVWGDSTDDADLAGRSTLCGRIWDLAHLTIKDIRASTGLTQTAFGQRFLIPARTIGNWEDGTNICPHYTRLMLARLCGLADGIFG